MAYAGAFIEYGLPSIEEAIGYAQGTYGAYQTAETVVDEMTSLKRKIQEALQEHPGQAAALAKKTRSGKERTGGFYGRYNNPENRTQENKFHDTTLGGTLADVSTVLSTGGQIALIPQGTEASERIGRKVTVHSIQLRGSVAVTTGSTAALKVWVILVQDTQCNGAAAAVTDVFTATGLANSMINLANSSRFRILKRLEVELTPSGGISGAPAWQEQIGTFSYFKKCRVPMEYSSTTGALTEIKSNNLFLIAGTKHSSTAGTPVVTLEGKCRLRFSD